MAFWGERLKTSALLLVQWEHFARPSWKYEGPYSYEPAFCCRDVGPNGPNNKHTLEEHLLARCQHNFNSGILASGKTRMAPKPSKTTAACWLASNSKNMPVAMKCQINNRKSKPSPTQTWICLGRLVATYNFAASPSLHYMIFTQDHFRPC